MHATIVLFGRWPMTRGCPKHHKIFDRHELCHDLFVSDTDLDQSLRDMLADGALVHVARRNGIHVELMALDAENHPIVLGFADVCDTLSLAESYDAMLEMLRQPPTHENTIRLVIIPNEPLAVDEPGEARKHSAAEASVQQAMAIGDALDKALRLADATPDPGNCFFCHYGGSTSRNGRWESTTSVSAIVPKSRLPLSTPANVNVLPTLVLGLFPDVDVQDNDLHHHDGVAVTIDEDEDGSKIRCWCRLIVEDERYTVTRVLPPNGVSSLSKAFLTIDDPTEWIIRDNQGVEENLATSAEWLASATPSRVLAACLPAVRDVSRRRAPIAIPDMVSQAAPPPTPTPGSSRQPTPTPVSSRQRPFARPPRALVEGTSEDHPTEPIPSRRRAPMQYPIAIPEVASQDAPPPTPTPASSLQSPPAPHEVVEGTSEEQPPEPPLPLDDSVSDHPVDRSKPGLLQVVETTFGKEAVMLVAGALRSLDGCPYTLVLGADNTVQVLPGALPPQLLEHLSTVVRAASLPLQSGETTELYNRHGSLRIGGVRLDLDVIVQHEQVLVYRSIAKEAPSSAAPSLRSRMDVRNGVERDSFRGSVPRFARRMEQVRSLLHR